MKGITRGELIDLRGQSDTSVSGCSKGGTASV